MRVQHHQTPAYGPAHRQNALLHVQRRAWERLGVALSTPDILALSAKCASGELGELGLADHGGRHHVMTTIRGHDVRLIYCPNLGLVVTFFQRPMGCKSMDRFLRSKVAQ